MRQIVIDVAVKIVKVDLLTVVIVLYVIYVN